MRNKQFVLHMSDECCGHRNCADECVCESDYCMICDTNHDCICDAMTDAYLEADLDF